LCSGLSSEVHLSLEAMKVFRLFGSGIRACASSELKAAKLANFERRPCVTFAARSAPKSQKNRNGVSAPNSSPMKSKGGEGAGRRQVIATLTTSGFAICP